MGVLKVTLKAGDIRVTLDLVVGLPEGDLPAEVLDLTVRSGLDASQSLLFTIPPDSVEICQQLIH